MLIPTIVMGVLAVVLLVIGYQAMIDGRSKLNTSSRTASPVKN